MNAQTDSSGDLIADRRYRFGRDLFSRGDVAGAIDLFAAAVAAAPDFAAAWLALGEAQQLHGDRSGAEAAFHSALAADPADRCGAALHLARLGAADAASAMSPTYVRALFDQYAPHFDAALAGLTYRGPAHLREAVERARPGARFDRVLDLGCGTGLAGAAFRPLARRMTGVDLSPAMLAEAHAKNIYDALEAGDLMAFLGAATERYDLVIAADVLVYLFDLGAVAAATAKVLRPGGLFAFTVEAGREGAGVVLGEKLRFRHGADHVRAALAAFRLIELSPAAIRTEAKEDVPGLLVVAEVAAVRQD